MPPESAPQPRNQVSSGWRVLSVLLALVLLLGWALAASLFEQGKAQIHHLEARLREVPQVRELWVLLDAQGKPALLVAYEPQTGRLQVQRLNAVKEGRSDSLHLWSVAEGDGPRLLGVIPSRYPTTQLNVAPEVMAASTRLGLSVEDKDKGPRDGKPALPWLWEGAVVRKAM